MKEAKFTLSRIVSKGENDVEYQIIGKLFEIPEVGKELIYLSNEGTKCSTGEYIDFMSQRPMEDTLTPGRLNIHTKGNDYIADKLGPFGEHARRGVGK